MLLTRLLMKLWFENTTSTHEVNSWGTVWHLYTLCVTITAWKKKSKNGSYTHTHMVIFILIILYIRSLINVCMDAGVTSLGLHVFTFVLLVRNKIGPIYDIERRFYNTIAYRLSTKSNCINHGCASGFSSRFRQAFSPFY